MSNYGAQNPYQGYGQQPPGMGGYGQPQYGNPQGMHGGPAGMATGATPPPARRGTSKALPIMVAAGLAVGVCGGLVLVLGTGSSDAATEKKTVAEGDSSGDDKPDSTDKPDGAGNSGETPSIAGTDPKPDETPEVKEPEKPKPAKITIDFEVDPEDAEISVDDDDVKDGAYTVELEPGQTKKVTIKAKASGYRNYSKEYEIAKNDTVKIELKKRSSSSSGSSGSSSSSRRKPKKPKGSLIDL